MRVAARSDVGLARHVNEDYVLVDNSLGLIVVADGQGGQVTGCSQHVSLRTVSASIFEPLTAISRNELATPSVPQVASSTTPFSPRETPGS